MNGGQEYPAQLEIAPQTSVRGSVRPPGSKSITNRALICAALASGTSRVQGCLDSEDTQVMRDGLRKLGIQVDDARHDEWVVHGGAGHLPAPSADLYVANSGTTIRFLTAVAALGHGTYTLDGNARMRQRPIGDLVHALRQLRVNIRAAHNDQFPPVTLLAGGLAGGSCRLRADVSSQFLSGLLMAAPCAQAPVRIELDGPLVSRPYVAMTLEVMREFGVSIAHRDWKQFEIAAPLAYQPTNYVVEPDASAASYFWAAAAVTEGDVTVADLHADAIQGDVAFTTCLQQMGCEVTDTPAGLRVRGGTLRGIDVDMKDISDTVPTLAIVALFANSPTTIRGVAHIRHKESDRIGDLARELRKLGAEIDEHPDGLTITPGPPRPARIATYDDHRMAMSFAIAGLRIPGVVIENPGCVAKTYPTFFYDLGKLCGQTG